MERWTTSFNGVQHLLVRPLFKERLNVFKIRELPWRRGIPLSSSILAEKYNISTGVIHPLKKFSLPQCFFSAWHVALLEMFHFFKIYHVKCFAQMFQLDGRAYCIYSIYIHDPFLSKNTTYTQGFYFIVMFFLFHSNVSLYYCMFFNQMVHSRVKEVLHILAPKHSLRNTTD